ncbi:MAG: DUF5110 domain-containing protein, partial [Balneolales bacterium]|nr:DUF5110 domain-containing protein [Balneolales bacterium]
KEGTLTGNIDFDNPEAAEYFKQQMKHFFDEGADFIKLDRTTHLPTVRTIFEMSQEFGLETEGRGFMLSHAGGLEDPEFKRYPTKWTSDTRSDWTIDDPNLDFNSWVPRVAFKENIEKYTDPDNPAHTVPFLTNDTGGFDMGLTDEANEELYIRWLQFSMLSPITEVFSQPENPTSNMAYKYSDRADEIFREFSHLRMQLFPYIYSYAHKTRLEGENMMKLFDGRLYQYGFGNELLVAPIYEEGATSRNVFLPEGTWYNYWDGTSIEGNQEIEADAPIHRIPVFAKAGSIIPMREYAPSIETGTNEVLSLHVYPGTNGSFTLIEDDGTSNDYLEGKYATTDILLTDNESSLELAINPRVGSYNGMFSSRTWEIVIHSPFSNSLTVNVNGEPQEFSIENGTLLIDAFTNDLKEEINLVVQFSD